jgi:hypothetical protein
MRQLLFSSLFLVVYLSVSACKTTPPATQNVTDVKTFAEDGAWCWFSDPRAVYYEGQHQRTYVGWIDSRGNVMVGFYDHQDRQTQTYMLHEGLEVDDHDNPALHFTEDGRLMVFYSEHSKETPIYQLISQNPEDISQWEIPRSLDLNDTTQYKEYSDTYTYVNVWPVGDQLFMLWRGADFKPNYSISKDDGQTWSTGEILILPKRIYRNRRPYLKAYSDGTRLHLAFTDGHPRRELENSIYYTYYQDGNFFKADNSVIGSLEDLPFSPGETDKVYDGASGDKAWIWDITARVNGQPVLTFTSFPEDSIHDYYYAHWDGSNWESERLVRAGSWFPDNKPGQEQREPNYSGGIVLDHENPEEVYLSLQKEGVFEIEHWLRDKTGEWSQTPITENSQRDNIRPYAVLGADKDNPLQLFFLTNEYYRHYTDYRSAIKMKLE